LYLGKGRNLALNLGHKVKVDAEGNGKVEIGQQQPQLAPQLREPEPDPVPGRPPWQQSPGTKGQAEGRDSQSQSKSKGKSIRLRLAGNWLTSLLWATTSLWRGRARAGATAAATARATARARTYVCGQQETGCQDILVVADHAVVEVKYSLHLRGQEDGY
jgi:hypothetical protein